MNRFRTKKKARDDVSAPRPSQDSESSMPFRPFRKGKKTQEPEKVEIDLSTALPSTDEFRTSLLMTGLSARFSMLREQDDPNTKIGKASDDSVLFPKRQSRLDYGGFRGLGDIAEVESIKAAAPFARKDSYNSDDADSMTASSIMGRSKATEGNNLFGGRQKIYKIPVGANPSKPVGGMGGRALYDDDVALSAFQRWRQAEKERKSTEDERDESEKRISGDMESDALRADSPILSNYNQKRETSSTTSSFPSMARNSTAATSVTSSHRAPSLKDWQPSASSTPVERSVTRTRRLYESGLNNDLHEQQSSALSRIDTLSRQRTFGTRTPDLATNSPSPTTAGFAERFGNERKILAKSSAPNLRSMSPPATASSAGTPDLGVRVPSATEMRSNFGGAPPLSPPISETEENSILPIHPSDRGKATALGVFQKPSQPYDESRYAQRQLQRQQGRETPTQRSRDEPNTSSLTNRSSSSSSAQRREIDTRPEAAPVITELTLDGDTSTSFLADPNDSDYSPAVSPKPIPSPQVLLRRPSDREHPAFRDSIVPPPLSATAKSSGEPSPSAEKSSSLTPNSKGISPVDSPTLGPTTGSGLSGMVRQHLRGDSNASSIYGGLPTTSGLESRFPVDPEAALAFEDLGREMNPWDFADAGRDWTLDLDVNEPMPDSMSRSSNIPDTEDLVGTRADNMANARDDRDEFASQLANGARRVRERLTTYVESDSRSASPHRAGDSLDSRDQQLPPRQNGFGLLRPKSSRGSLVDRGRDAPQSKAMKMLGIGAPSSAPPAVPTREPVQEEREREVKPLEPNEWDDRANSAEEPSAGLRAFRQARRELQRMKELETQTRHQPSGSVPDSDSSLSTPTRERPSKHRSPERDRKPPPIFYQQRTPSEESRKENLHFESWDQSRSDRDRSGSDSSNDARSNSRPPRPINNAGGRGNLQIGPNGAAPRPPMRSPGLPGTDIKRSPIMPPQPYPGSSRSKQSNLAPNSNLHVQTSGGFESGQPSPVSPIPSPYAANGPPTPVNTLPSSPRPAASPSHGSDNIPTSTNDAMRRKVKPRDISDPTFVMSSSRVPTVALPDDPRNRSRSNSRSAPPLPPINPRRRQDFSSTRAVFDNLSRRNGESIEGEASASTPNLAYGKSANRDDDPRPERRRLRPMASEALGLNSRMPNNAPPINVGPPASRQVVTQGAKRPGMGLPGGMI